MPRLESDVALWWRVLRPGAKMVIRYSKVLLTAAMALFASLVAFGNITDYGSNFAFVHHVLLMDTVFPDTTIKYRAINSVAVQHVAYVLIIAAELLVAILCWTGAWRLFRSRCASAREFNRRKGVAIAGLTLGFLVWQVGFMSFGGEWFGMWMSEQWNGVTNAFQFSITMCVVLVYVTMRDEDVDDSI